MESVDQEERREKSYANYMGLNLILNMKSLMRQLRQKKRARAALPTL